MRISEKTVAVLLVVAGAVALCFGWRRFLFLCDDAYISFRYASNSILGYGYVWNPPPFRPVEGYTSFLWVLLLDGWWRVSGIEPPSSATVVSLLFSLGTLLLVCRMTWSMQWSPGLRRFRPLFLALVLAAVLTNRTFLAWTSSGLETALFNFLATLWLYGCFFGEVDRRGLLAISGTAALLALTRPDGLLFVAATVGMGLMPRAAESRRLRGRRLLSLLPMLIVAVHLLWRKRFYGEWLPNTYFAKYSGAWPEAGMRYLLSFILEYAVWTWMGVMLFLLVRHLRETGRRGPAAPTIPSESGVRRHFALSRVRVRVIACSVLIAHLGYYCLVIGGDHFEYRILSHLVPLIWVSFVWSLNRIAWKPSVAVAVVASAIALSGPIPWTHWALTHERNDRASTVAMFEPVAPHWPAVARWYAEMFDGCQAWLIPRLICIRHQEHKVACRWWLDTVVPDRREGAKIPADDHPVMLSFGGIGGLGWVLPHVAIVDLHGLNDYVVARSPADRSKTRKMAHDRIPPEEYTRSFRPNVFLGKNRTVIVSPRPEPLTSEEIVAIEKKWWALVSRP